MLMNGKEANNLIISGEVFTKENHIGKKGTAYGDGETETADGKTVSYFSAIELTKGNSVGFDPHNIWSEATNIPNGTAFIVKGETDNDWLLIELMEDTKISHASGNISFGQKGYLYWLNKKKNSGNNTKIIYNN